MWDKALINRHSAENQKNFFNATVAVCGLGGIGSSTAIILARAGIGKLILVDYDEVDITNIHRQQYKFSQIGQRKVNALANNIREINPFVDIETHHIKITTENTLSLMKNADIICEAFDKAETKALFVNDILEKLPEKYLISSSGMAGFLDANTIKTKKITKHFYICGDFISDVKDNTTLVSSRVMICAAHQAHKVLQILLKEGQK